MRLPLSGLPFLARFLILGTVALFFGRGVGHVSAEIIHHLKFTQGPVVLVWEDDGAPVIGQKITLARPHEIPVLQPLAGRLDPVPVVDLANDPGVIHKTFWIASNAPFEIAALVQPRRAFMDANLSLTMGRIGENAAAPAPSGTTLAMRRLSQLRNEQILTRTTTRTANQSGRPFSQALEFTVSWPANARADVTLTVRALDPKPAGA